MEELIEEVTSEEMDKREHRFRVFEPIGEQTLSPIARNYHDNIEVGDGLSNVIVRRTKDDKYFRPHVFLWLAPPHYSIPEEKEYSAGDEGIVFERVGGMSTKKSYAYQFNPSRYSDEIDGSPVYIADLETGLYGRLPHIIFLNPLSMVDGDGLDVVNECEQCPGGEEPYGVVKYTFRQITASHTPMTYPINPQGKIHASAYRPAGIGVRAEDKKCFIK